MSKECILDVRRCADRHMTGRPQTNKKHRFVPSYPKPCRCADVFRTYLVQDNSIRRKAKPSRPTFFIARLRIRVRFALLAARTGPFLDRNHGFSTFEFVSERASLDASVVTVSKERIVVFLWYRSRLCVFSREPRCTKDCVVRGNDGLRLGGYQSFRCSLCIFSTPVSNAITGNLPTFS